MVRTITNESCSNEWDRRSDMQTWRGCSEIQPFDWVSNLLKYDLKDAGLLRLAKIVHAADVAEDIDTDPIARGLEAIASGYSLRYPEDMENLEHQFEVYDALYAWCRMEVAKGDT